MPFLLLSVILFTHFLLIQTPTHDRRMSAENATHRLYYSLKMSTRLTRSHSQSLQRTFKDVQLRLSRPAHQRLGLPVSEQTRKNARSSGEKSGQSYSANTSTDLHRDANCTARAFLTLTGRFPSSCPGLQSLDDSTNIGRIPFQGFHLKTKLCKSRTHFQQKAEQLHAPCGA